MFPFSGTFSFRAAPLHRPGRETRANQEVSSWFRPRRRADEPPIAAHAAQNRTHVVDETTMPG
jgi:hypothetical protein